MSLDLPETLPMPPLIGTSSGRPSKHVAVVICANAREVERVQTWWAGHTPPKVYTFPAHSEGLTLTGLRFHTIILRGVYMDALGTALRERLVRDALPDCTWIGLP